MSWIRSPAWDGFWILSGVPLGIALSLLALVGPAMPITVMVTLFLANAHGLAPIIAGWSNAGLRGRMLARPGKYIGLPVVLLVGASALGIGTSLLDPHYIPDFSPDTQIGSFAGHNPFALLVIGYTLWNAFHFGKQNFGVLRLYGGGSRHIDKAYACGTTWAAMAIPLIPAWAHEAHRFFGWPARPYPFLDYIQDVYFGAALILGGAMVAHEIANGNLPRVLFSATLALGMVAAFWARLWVFAIILVNHWLVAIGLSSAVYSRWHTRSFTFVAAGLVFAGAFLFAALFLRPDLTLRLTAWGLGFRIGLGFVHFLYDRWIYKLSDPFVRETVGKALRD